MELETVVDEVPLSAHGGHTPYKRIGRHLMYCMDVLILLDLTGLYLIAFRKAKNRDGDLTFH